MSDKPRVFLVQEPLRKSVARGVPEFIFDLAPAREYGDIVICLDWADTKHGFKAQDITDKLRVKLADYNSDDYLLMTGNPCAMALAAMIASDVNDGIVNLLVWSRVRTDAGNEGFYRVMNLDIFKDDGDEHNS